MERFYLHLLFLSLLLHPAQAADFVDTAPIERISFGSCSHQDREQPLWSEIARWDPDYFIWLGDAVYADSRDFLHRWKPPSISRYSEVLHQMKTSADYQSFTQRRTKITGVWDDHDYGVNDGGASDDVYTSAVQDIFLHFLDEPADSPRFHRKGLYGSYLLGSGEDTLKLILLDPRSQLRRNESTVLGADQWAWLEAELKSDPTPLTLLGTGLPLLTDRLTLDRWLLYPLERERLLGLISRRPNTIIMSGDSHFADLLCGNTTRGPLFELQSSGMTHNCIDWIPEIVCKYIVTYITHCSACFVAPFVGFNFGGLSIIWGDNGEPTKVVMEARGKNEVELHYVVELGGTTPDQHCPPRHQVEHQVVWQITAMLFVTTLLLLFFYLLSFIIISIYARIVLHRKYKPHNE